MQAIISILIVIIGSDIAIDSTDDFAVGDIGEEIGTAMGLVAKVLFCLGLYAAACVIAHFSRQHTT
jgi:hypothetical protein